MNFKLNERKMEIKFEKPKPVKKKKGRDDAGKKAKTGEVLLVWDPDIDFDPDKPFSMERIKKSGASFHPDGEPTTA